MNTAVTRKILDHLGLPSSPPAAPRARAPPVPELPGFDSPADPAIDPPSPWN